MNGRCESLISSRFHVRIVTEGPHNSTVRKSIGRHLGLEPRRWRFESSRTDQIETKIASYYLAGYFCFTTCFVILRYQKAIY